MDITKLIVAGTVVFCVTVPFVASHAPHDKAAPSSQAQDAAEPEPTNATDPETRAAN